MKALICPNESASTGFRIAEISETGFEVAEPLFWVECDETITSNEHFYDKGEFKPLFPVLIEQEKIEATEPQPISKNAQDF